MGPINRVTNMEIKESVKDAKRRKTGKYSAKRQPGEWDLT